VLRKGRVVLELAIMVVFPFAVAFAASMDVFTMTIPNRLTLALAAAFFVMAPFVGLGPTKIAFHLLTGIAMLAAGIALFACGVFGGGDAKLLAAVALWIGLENLPVYMMMVAVSGGILSILMLAYRRFPQPRILLGQAWAERLHAKNGGIPYGVALGAAALWVYPQTTWWTQLAG